MKPVKAIVALIVALSIAMLPVAGSVAYAASLEKSPSATSECCLSHGTPCEKKMPPDCDLACAIKCAASSAALVTPASQPPRLSVTERSLAAAVLVPFSSQSPPLPPPRL